MRVYIMLIFSHEKNIGKSLVNPLTYWTLSNLYHELKNQITSTLNFQNSLIYPLGWF
jgi:hypothetical protein